MENKIRDTSSLVKNTDCDSEITDIEGKIPDVSNLATKTALTAVENKIPEVRRLVKKALKLQKLKINLMIIITINILIIQGLIN